MLQYLKAHNKSFFKNLCQIPVNDLGYLKICNPLYDNSLLFVYTYLLPKAIAFHIALTANPEEGLSNDFMDEETEVNL